jgi:hypothetical protein
LLPHKIEIGTSTQTGTLTVSNSTDAAIRGACLISGKDRAEFSCTPSSLLLLPGKPFEVKVSFDATSAEVRLAVLS